MATKIITNNGFTTGVPGVYADPRTSPQGGVSNLDKVLAIVGEFEWLENGKVAEFTSSRRLLSTYGDFDEAQLIADIAFNPAADARITRPPQTVLLASTLASTAASLGLDDENGKQVATLSSRVSGQTGNQLSVTLTPSATPLRLDLTVTKSGATEQLLNLGSGPVVSVSYDGAYFDGVFLSAVPYYDDLVEKTVGEVQITVLKNLAGGATEAIATDGRACASKVLLTPSDAMAGTVNVSVTGIRADTGAAHTETVAFTIGQVEAKPTAYAYSRVDSITVGAYAGTIAASWTKVRMNRANGVTTLKRVADVINAFVDVSATVLNARAPSLELGALDILESSDLTVGVVNLRCDNFEFARRVNAESVYVSAELVEGTTQPNWDLDAEYAAVTGTTALALGNYTGVAAGTVLALGVNDLGSTSLGGDAGGITLFKLVDSVFTTTVAAGSNGDVLPQSTIDVVSTTGAPSAGVISFELSGGTAYVSYTGKTATSFTGCTLLRGSGTLATGDAVKAVVLATAMPYSAIGDHAYRWTALANLRVDALSSTPLGGGATGLTTSLSRAACFEALRLTETSVLAVLSQDATIIQDAHAHAAYMAGAGARECNVWAGAEADQTIEQLNTLTVAYNSRHIAFTAQEIRVLDRNGNRRWLSPMWQALQLAAMQCCVRIGAPLTFKRPRVLDVRSNAAWDGTIDADALLDAGVVTYSRDNLGFKVTRSITTYRASDDINQVEVSANESAYWSIRDLRAYMLGVIGTSNVEVDPRGLLGLAVDRLRYQAQSKIIARYVENSAYAETSAAGDATRIGYEYNVVVPNNFLILEPASVSSAAVITI